EGALRNRRRQPRAGAVDDVRAVSASSAKPGNAGATRLHPELDAMGETMNPIDRYLGAMVGLAVGDAIGTTVEFKKPGTFPRVIDMTGGGPFGLRPGQWTDDTSMALCLAESLVEQRGFDARDQMSRYLRWYRKGYLS